MLRQLSSKVWRSKGSSGEGPPEGEGATKVGHVTVDDENNKAATSGESEAVSSPFGGRHTKSSSESSHYSSLSSSGSGIASAAASRSSPLVLHDDDSSLVLSSGQVECSSSEQSISAKSYNFGEESNGDAVSGDYFDRTPSWPSTVSRRSSTALPRYCSSLSTCASSLGMQLSSSGGVFVDIANLELKEQGLFGSSDYNGISSKMSTTGQGLKGVVKIRAESLDGKWTAKLADKRQRAAADFKRTDTNNGTAAATATATGERIILKKSASEFALLVDEVVRMRRDNLIRHVFFECDAVDRQLLIDCLEAAKSRHRSTCVTQRTMNRLMKLTRDLVKGFETLLPRTWSKQDTADDDDDNKNNIQRQESPTQKYKLECVAVQTGNTRNGHQQQQQQTDGLNNKNSDDRQSTTAPTQVPKPSNVVDGGMVEGSSQCEATDSAEGLATEKRAALIVPLLVMAPDDTDDVSEAASTFSCSDKTVSPHESQNGRSAPSGFRESFSNCGRRCVRGLVVAGRAVVRACSAVVGFVVSFLAQVLRLLVIAVLGICYLALRMVHGRDCERKETFGWEVVEVSGEPMRLIVMCG